MKTMFGALKATFGVALLATVFASLANAQCVDLSAFKRGAPRLQRQSWTGGSGPALFKRCLSGWLPKRWSDVKFPAWTPVVFR